LAEVNCCSAQVIQHKQQTLTSRKKSKPMSKNKKNVKVRDLKPKKNAKGGGGHSALGGGSSALGGGTSVSGGGTSVSGGGTSVSGGGVSKN
jgi:hypothetical protein